MPLARKAVPLALTAIAAAAVMAAAGCGSDSTDGIETRSPERTFAPLVRLDPDERSLPIGARWFLERSVLWFADDQGCGDRKIAVGRELEAQQNAVVDWLYVYGLGASSPSQYWRGPYHADCGSDGDYRVYAHQHTRPYDDADRMEGLRPTEGYYLDLMDWARGGQPLRRSGRELAVGDVPAYVERRNQEVDGEPGLRLTYWLLYGRNEPAEAGGGEPRHEGDWERLDVLLQEGDGESEYVPVTVRFDSGGRTRDVPWESMKRVKGGGSETTHPLVSAARGDHELSPARARGDCEGCPLWRTWVELTPARKERWYGFGGAWGDVGRTSDTTGPLGPHGKWPPDSLSRAGI